MLRATQLPRHRSLLAIAAAVEGLEPRTFLSASSIDTSFSGDGKNALAVGDSSNFRAVTVLPNGKTLVAGVVDLAAGAAFQNDFLIARFNADGSLDMTFGGGDGWVNTNFYNFPNGQAQDQAEAIVQLPGGKFAVAGTTKDGFSLVGSNFAVAQYNADGSPDNGFSGDGKLVVDYGADSQDEVTALAVTSEYKLLVVGMAAKYTVGGTYADVAIAKVKSDGTLDALFSGGKIKKDFGTVFGPEPSSGNDDLFANQLAKAVSVLPNGNILIAGRIESSAQSSTFRADGFVARFSSNGLLDASFSGNGFTQTSTAPGAGDEGFNALAVLKDGKILAGGSTEPDANDSINDDFVLVRYSAGGTKDNAFATNGIARTSFTGFGPASDVIRSLIVQPTGKILAVGFSFPEDHEQPTRTALARYNAGGTLDSSFSGDGKLLSAIIPSFGALAAAATPDGKTVVVGGRPGVIARFGSDAAATAKISGTFYNDLNGNGARNPGEGPLADWQAFVDANNDGFWTPGEKIATSDAAGNCTIKGLVPGTYRIREIRLTNWNRTQPAGVYPLGFYDVTVGLGGTAIGKDFGNRHV